MNTPLPSNTAALKSGSSGTHKRALISTLAISGSRVFGLLREQVFAYFFGASAVFDAFVVAFRIPNLLRDLLAEGALSQSFVAVFSKKLGLGQKVEAIALAHKVFTFIQVLVGMLVVLGILFSPELVSALASSFTGDKFTLTVTLTRLLMPFILLAALAALVMGILNAFNKYFIPHSASTVFNIVSMLSGLLCMWYFAPTYWAAALAGDLETMRSASDAARAIMAMAAGVLFGGVAQYAMQLPILWKQGVRLKYDFHFRDSALKEVLLLTGPAILGGAAVQVNVLVNTQFAASLGDGAVSWINYAFRFMQFPLGIFGVAIASASAPTFAKLLAQNRLADMRQTLQTSIGLCLFLCVPASCLLLILAQPIVGLIYQHGRFQLNDTLMTAQALMAYSVAITGYSLIKIYQPAFLAFGNSKGPMRISLLSIAFNAILNTLFIVGLHFGHWSLAMSTSVVASSNFLFLAWLFRKHLPDVWDRACLLVFGKIAGAAALSLALTFGLMQMNSMFAEPNSKLAYLQILLITGGFYSVTYLVFCSVFKVREVSWLLRKLRRR